MQDNILITSRRKHGREDVAEGDTGYNHQKSLAEGQQTNHLTLVHETDTGQSKALRILFRVLVSRPRYCKEA